MWLRFCYSEANSSGSVDNAREAATRGERRKVRALLLKRLFQIKLFMQGGEHKGNKAQPEKQISSL